MTEHSLWRFSRALHGAINDRQSKDLEDLIDEDVDWAIYGPIDMFPFLGARHGKIERQDRRLGVSGGDDFVVERFELAHDSSVQHHGRALGGAGQRENAAQAASRARDEHDASG